MKSNIRLKRILDKQKKLLKYKKYLASKNSFFDYGYHNDLFLNEISNKKQYVLNEKSYRTIKKEISSYAFKHSYCNCSICRADKFSKRQENKKKFKNDSCFEIKASGYEACLVNFVKKYGSNFLRDHTINNIVTNNMFAMDSEHSFIEDFAKESQNSLTSFFQLRERVSVNNMVRIRANRI